MKSASVAMQAHIKQDCTTLATLWKVTRRDNTVLAFTDHDQDLVYGGVTYLAATGFVRTAVVGAGDLSASNSEVDILLDSSAITDSDLRKGLYDYATFEVRVVNWADLTMGEIKLLTGKLGQVQARDVMAKTELRSLLQLLTPHLLKQYSPTCRAILGDSKCGVNLAALGVAVTVTAVTDGRTFSVSGLGGGQPDGWAKDGKITWDTGSNAGASMEVKSQTGAGAIVLYLPMGYTVQVGDTATLYPGCNRELLGDCKTKFNNVLNFRGEPYVPGLDNVLLYPNAH